MVSSKDPGGSKQIRSGLQLIVKLFWLVIILASLGSNAYLIGLLMHTTGSYTKLVEGGTAAYPGLIKQASSTSLTIETTAKDPKTKQDKKSLKNIAIPNNTLVTIFPKNYQTLIPLGLPSSISEIVVNKTEASVSAKLPYLKAPQASRISLVRDDLLTGKIIELTSNTIKFKAYASQGYVDQTLALAPNVQIQKLGDNNQLTTINLTDAKVGQGLYAYLNKPAGPDDAIIQRLVLADFTSTTK